MKLFGLLLLDACTALVTPPALRRRDFIAGTAAVTSLAAPFPAAAAAAGPITILGASGRTGALCVVSCLKRGVAVRALTRSGECPDGIDPASPGLTVGKCDVREASSIAAGVAGSSGVVYAASASKKGGNAKLIDNLAVVAAAEACLANKVPRYAVVSSTAVTRPASLGYKFTNVLGGIMDEKKLGEDGVKRLYAADGSASSYVIVRPGGLEETDKVVGVGGLEISQGDALAGIINRADLGEAMVEIMLSDAPGLRDCTLEIYGTEKAQACEGRFKPLLKDGSIARLHGESWKELLRDVKQDGDYFVPA